MRLKEVANISTGYSFRSKIRHNPQGETKVIRMGDVDKNIGVKAESVSKVTDFNPRNRRYFLDEGDIIMMSKGYNLNAFLIPEGLGKVVAVNSFIVLKVKSSKVLPAYLVWFLNSKRTQHFLKAVASGTSTPNLSKRALEAVEIPVPSQRKQQLLCEINQLKRKQVIYHQKIASKKEQLIDAILQKKNDEWTSNN